MIYRSDGYDVVILGEHSYGSLRVQLVQYWAHGHLVATEWQWLPGGPGSGGAARPANDNRAILARTA